MVIDPDGPECSGGNRGCVEALCSGTAVARIANERLAAGEDSVLADEGGRGVDSKIVVDAARAGDGFSMRVLEEVGANLGIMSSQSAARLGPGDHRDRRRHVQRA